MSEELKGEVAVIGSGPGGAVTAALLAEAGRSVTVIEEGEALAASSCAPFSLEEMRSKYRNAGITPAFGAAKIAYVEGKVLGGGSEINSALYHRTPEPALADWSRRFEVAGLSAAELAPHFEVLERELPVARLPGPPSEASARLARGASSVGLEPVEVPRMFAYSGKTDAAGLPAGSRRSMSETFLPRARAAGARILPNCRVARLYQYGAGWRLQLDGPGAAPGWLAADRVFVCGGAIQTPALLQRSGIGVNIGNSLALHPTLKVVARFEDPVNSAGMGVGTHQAKDAAGAVSYGCSISSPAHLALALIDHPGALAELRRDWRNMAVYYAAARGAGTGSVRRVPGFSDPLVRYPVALEDLDALTRGLKELCRLLFAAGATRIYPAVAGLGPFSSPGELAGLPERLAPETLRLITIHLFGSTPMGEKRSLCAADSFGKLHGQRNIFVSDASLLCGAPGVNPQGTIMAIARRNALKFLGKL